MPDVTRGSVVRGVAAPVRTYIHTYMQTYIISPLRKIKLRLMKLRTSLLDPASTVRHFVHPLELTPNSGTNAQKRGPVAGIWYKRTSTCLLQSPQVVHGAQPVLSHHHRLSRIHHCQHHKEAPCSDALFQPVRLSKGLCFPPFRVDKNVDRLLTELPPNVPASA